MRVAVFTGSSVGLLAHQAVAVELAESLAGSGVGIVYGGGHVGLMGMVADAALAAGGEVIGVMPQHMVDQEIGHRSLTRLEVVASMHERKARMAELADAFVALPGGAGTLEELFEAFTWGQLGLHAKPTALLDGDGFYAPLIAQLDAMTAAGYLDPARRNSLPAVANGAELLRFIASYQHPQQKWTRDSTAQDDTRSAVIVSVGWIEIRDDHLLAVRTRGRDRFYLPGGKIEPGEDHEQALVREVREELGLGLDNVRPAFTVTAPAHGYHPGRRLVMHCYYATALGDPQPAAEIEEMAWLEPTDQRAAPAVRAVLDKVT